MPITVPNLDDRSFDEILAEAVARIPVHTPEWNNFNDSDPGMTLVQLFAFMTENLLYRSNRIPEANRLKFLSLLGVPLRPPSAARGLVQFTNDRGPLMPLVFDADSELLAGKVPFRTRTSVNILPITAAAFFKRPRPEADVDPAIKEDYLNLYGSGLNTSTLTYYQSVPFEEPQIGKTLPEVNLAANGDTTDQSLWLALLAPNKVDPNDARRVIAEQTLTLGIYPANSIVPDPLYPVVMQSPETADPGLSFEIPAPLPDQIRLDTGDAIPAARYKRLEVAYAENVLEMPGIVQLILPRFEDLRTWEFDPLEEGRDDYPPLLEDRRLADRLITWIRIRLLTAPTRANFQHTRLTWVGINTARVLQIIPVSDERLGFGTGTPEQSFKLANTPVIVEQTAPGKKNFHLYIPDDAGEQEEWTLTDDLYAAPVDAKVYTLDAESGQIAFGDGLRGRRPPAGRAITVSYEYGGGSDGSVAIGAINKSPLLPGGFKVTNPVATWGAASGEDATEGEHKISRFLRHRDRLVTAEDFRDIALQTPSVEIGRVEVLPVFHPEQFNRSLPSETWPGVVTVMVVPQHPLEQETPARPDRLFLSAVCDWLDPRRLVTTEVYARGPQYVEMIVAVALTTLPGYLREEVSRDVRAAIRTYLSPLVGGPTPPGRQGKGWPLGVELRAQDIMAVVVRVEGVRLVSEVRLGEIALDGRGNRFVQEIALGTARTFAGIELPWLSGLDVVEGESAADPASLVGSVVDTDIPGGNLPANVVVPLRPKKC